MIFERHFGGLEGGGGHDPLTIPPHPPSPWVCHNTLPSPTPTLPSSTHLFQRAAVLVLVQVVVLPEDQQIAEVLHDAEVGDALAARGLAAQQ